MHFIPHCNRCGYANAPSWPRCWCCGRPVGQCAHQASRAPRTRTRRPAAGDRTGRVRRCLELWRRRPGAATRSEPEDLAALIAAW